MAEGEEPCYSPAFLNLRGRTTVVRAASGLAGDQLAALNWGTMWSQNLISIALGNIVSGGIFVGVIFFLAHVCGTEVCKPRAA